MSFGLAMSLNELARRLEKEGRKQDAEIVKAAIHEMDLIDGNRARDANGKQFGYPECD